MTLLSSVRYSIHVIFHPFDGFWDLKAEKRGTLGGALILLLLLIMTVILQRQYTGFILNQSIFLPLSMFKEASSVLLPFALWCVANWCLTTLMDGEGGFTDIIVSSAYALTPLIIIPLPLILFSNVISMEESSFYSLIYNIAILWSACLMLVSTMTVHQYSFLKSVVTIVLIFIAMGIILFVGLLFFALIQQMINFILTLYFELTLRH